MLSFDPKTKYNFISSEFRITEFSDYSEEFVARPPYQRKNVWSPQKQNIRLDGSPSVGQWTILIEEAAWTIDGIDVGSERGTREGSTRGMVVHWYVGRETKTMLREWG
ncbi:hypothetical protein [Natrinema soli]|uniref:hypothetical protein n=1 Tax=Natrinema soli TaxID=1930624 RepID=UPI0023610381|nr:hypothetical protein [Natrinema soli]